MKFSDEFQSLIKKREKEWKRTSRKIYREIQIRAPLCARSSFICAEKLCFVCCENELNIFLPSRLHPSSLLAPDSIDWTLFSLCNFHRSPASTAQQKHAKKTTISRFYKWQRESLERRTKKRFPRELHKSRNNNSIIIHSLLCRCHVHMRLWSRRRLELT